MSLAAVAELEDPRKLLDQAVTDMQADLAKMRQASAQVNSLCMMMNNDHAKLTVSTCMTPQCHSCRLS